MKKKIAVLGSTGSIGETVLNIIKKDKKNFEVVLLTANRNSIKLLKQAKQFNVKNLIINDKKEYEKLKKRLVNTHIKIFNNYSCFNKVFKKKIDYVMSSIVGIDGLYPTINIIKYTKKIAIANKESIICAWNLIDKELKKNKTEFVPVDSEHFSIWYAIRNLPSNKINRIYLTASGGPLLNISNYKFDKLKISQIIKHPNWSMGKKISVDSATMMNKIFEIIEAKKIFSIKLNKVKVLIHPRSYIHSIIEFDDGMIKIIAHDTTMRIPIFNTIYNIGEKKILSKKIDIKKLNNLNLMNIDNKKFPLIKILSKIPQKNSLFETIIVSANDALVNLFLKKEIKFSSISKILLKLLVKKEFAKFKRIIPKNINEIIKINDYVRSKINSKSI